MRCTVDQCRRLELAHELRLQRLQREQVVAEYQPVENVGVRYLVLWVITPASPFHQNARLPHGPHVLADPSKFQFLFTGHQ